MIRLIKGQSATEIIINGREISEEEIKKLLFILEPDAIDITIADWGETGKNVNVWSSGCVIAQYILTKG